MPEHHTHSELKDDGQEYVTMDVLRATNQRLKDEMMEMINELLPQTQEPKTRPPSPVTQHPLSNVSIASSQASSEIQKVLLRSINKYHATGAIEHLLEYFDNLDDYFAAKEVSYKEELLVATAKLTANAKMWWREHRTTYSIFEEMDKIPFDASTTIHPNAIYTSKRLNFADLPQPVNSNKITIISSYNGNYIIY